MLLFKDKIILSSFRKISILIFFLENFFLKMSELIFCKGYFFYIKQGKRTSYVAGIMADGKVGRLLARFGRLGLQIVGTLAEMVVVQFFLEGLVGGLGEHRLFLKNGEDTHRLRRKRKKRNALGSVTFREVSHFPRVALRRYR